MTTPWSHGSRTGTINAPRLVAELVNLPVNILLTFNTSNARVAWNATDTIPIIMITGGYPLEVGLAVSLARPGGNVTGNSIYAGGEVFDKHLSLIRELKPSIRKLGVLWDYGPPAFDPRDGETALAELRKAARALSVALSLQVIRSREDVIPALGEELDPGAASARIPEQGWTDYTLRGLARARVAVASALGGQRLRMGGYVSGMGPTGWAIAGRRVLELATLHRDVRLDFPPVILQPRCSCGLIAIGIQGDCQWLLTYFSTLFPFIRSEWVGIATRRWLQSKHSTESSSPPQAT